MTLENIGHFKIDKKIGEGGMGEVYLAHDTSLQRQVAIKLLPERLCADENLRQRFLQEARSASALNHPNVCTIYEVGETGSGQPYICMEFLDGESLEKVISDNTSLPIPRICEIVRQIVTALCGAFEKRIVHRDLKPGNVSMNSQDVVKLLDFGLAKRLGMPTAVDDSTLDLNLTNEGRILGTPNYMSPEQALATEVDHRSDIFSVGVILYELITGSRPFSGDSIGQVINNIINQPVNPAIRLNPDVSQELDRIIRKCLEKDAVRRYQTPRDLLTDLENLDRGTINANNLSANLSGSQWTAELAGSPNNSDVFISYSALDDQSLSANEEGWISRFHRNLKVRLQQLAGREVHVYRPPKFDANDSVDANVLNEIPTAKSMLTIVSPPFVNSENCQNEVTSFVEGKSGDNSRIIKVVKTPVEDDQLANLSGSFDTIHDHEFYERDEETGRVLEFEESFGDDLKRRYYEKIYDVAHDINQTLSEAASKTAEIEVAGRKVFVAMTTSDVRQEYEIICRELTEQGFKIVPDKSLALEKSSLEDEVAAYLEDCEFAVQLIGGNYGIVPENATNSLLELQSGQIRNWVAESDARQFIWIAKDLEVTDERQQSFLDHIRTTDAASHQCDVIEGQVTLLKETLRRRLAENKSDSSDAHETSTVKQIYLICDGCDVDASAPLEDYLFDQGFEVLSTDFESASEEISELHRENLVCCDAVVIYYGAVRKNWVDIKLRDTLKAAGYGRSAPISNVGVYIAPPEDKRKERFKSHMATTIQQNGDAFAATDQLSAYLTQITQNG